MNSAKNWAKRSKLDQAVFFRFLFGLNDDTHSSLNQPRTKTDRN
jgi:hypothetical protein